MKKQTWLEIQSQNSPEQIPGFSFFLDTDLDSERMEITIEGALYPKSEEQFFWLGIKGYAGIRFEGKLFLQEKGVEIIPKEVLILKAKEWIRKWADEKIEILKNVKIFAK